MPRKLKTLTIGEKLWVLEAAESVKKMKDFAEVFGILASTLSTIIKNIKQIGLNFLNRSEEEESEFSDIDESVVKWFKQCRVVNVNIGGPILKEKADKFAISLGYRKFKISNG